MVWMLLVVLLSFLLPWADCKEYETHQSKINKEWKYGEGGPAQWQRQGHPKCGGKTQSPINIVKGDALEKSNEARFKYENIAEEIKDGELHNNGHSIHFSSDIHDISVTGGHFKKNRFNVDQWHWHVGSEDGKGSEHTFDGQKFPMELHIVLHNQDKYKEFVKAKDKDYGVAVISFVYEVKPDDNGGLEQVVEALPQVKKPSPDKYISLNSSVTLKQFLPRNGFSGRYYHYEGSLTTPECDQKVTWTLFPDPIPVSEKQLNAFRALETFGGRKMVDNNRPVQEIHERKVNFVKAASGADNLQVAAVWMSTIVLVFNIKCMS